MDKQAYLREVAERLNKIADTIDTPDANLEEIDQTIFSLALLQSALQLWKQNHE